MEQLLKERHEIELLFGKKKFTFVYFDATLRELIELKVYIEKEGDMREWLFAFLKKHVLKRGIIKTGFNRRHFDKIHEAQLADIIDIVMKKWSAGMYGEQENPKKKIKNDDFFSGQDVDSPDSALIMRLVEKSNETLDTLLDRTWRTIKYMLDGMVWNMRSETEDGQKDNMKQANKENFEKKNIDPNEVLNKMMKRLEAKRAKEEAEQKLQNNKI